MEGEIAREEAAAAAKGAGAGSPSPRGPGRLGTAHANIQEDDDVSAVSSQHSASQATAADVAAAVQLCKEAGVISLNIDNGGGRPLDWDGDDVEALLGGEAGVNFCQSHDLGETQDEKGGWIVQGARRCASWPKPVESVPVEMGSEKPAWYCESILKSKNKYNIKSRTTTKGSKLKECGRKTSANSPPVEGSHAPVMACKQAERQKASLLAV